MFSHDGIPAPVDSGRWRSEGIGQRA